LNEIVFLNKARKPNCHSLIAYQLGTIGPPKETRLLLLLKKQHRNDVKYIFRSSKSLAEPLKKQHHIEAGDLPMINVEKNGNTVDQLKFYQVLNK
jgi:hypothetical protein